MRLVLELPHEWQSFSDEDTFSFVKEGFATKLVTVELMARGATNRDQRERMVREVAPAGHEMIIVSDAPGKSKLGWPVDVIEARMATKDQERKILRSYLFGFYGFLERAGIVWADGPVDEVEAHHDELLELIMTGRSDWGPEPASIHDLFAGVESTKD